MTAEATPLFFARDIAAGYTAAMSTLAVIILICILVRWYQRHKPKSKGGGKNAGVGAADPSCGILAGVPGTITGTPSKSIPYNTSFAYCARDCSNTPECLGASFSPSTMSCNHYTSPSGLAHAPPVNNDDTISASLKKSLPQASGSIGTHGAGTIYARGPDKTVTAKDWTACAAECTGECLGVTYKGPSTGICGIYNGVAGACIGPGGQMSTSLFNLLETCK